MKSLGKFFVDVMINLKSALGTFVREYSNPEKLPPSAELSFSSGDRHQRSRRPFAHPPTAGADRAGGHYGRQ